MCWISTRKDGKAIAKVAKKDIPVIKIGYQSLNRFVSVAYEYEYCMGNLQKNIKIRPFGMHNKDIIHKGYHFYKPGMICIKKLTASLLTVDSVLRMYCRHYLINNTSCIAKGYVPKGTKYYLNANGEGVAEQIVLTEMIDLNDYLTNKTIKV